MSVHSEITFIFNLLDPKGTWTNSKTNSSYVQIYVKNIVTNMIALALIISEI